MNIIVIVHVNKQYKDVSDVFFALLKKNWAECPFQIVVSYKGVKYANYGYTEYIAPNNTSLPQDIFEIMNTYNANFCISFLGDALIGKEIINEEICAILQTLISKKASYCRLYHSGNMTNCLREIPWNESYGVSFIAFFCSIDFARKEFIKKTDLEFEKKYLAIARGKRKTSMRGMYELPNSCLGVLHGIVKGKWRRRVYKQLSPLIEQIQDCKHEQMTLKEDIVEDLRCFLRNYIFRGSFQNFFKCN